jgi:hypothetical protein
MALTISTGFVVDDAIVVIENITRYLEQGMSPCKRPCAARGDRLSRCFRSVFRWCGVHSDLLMGGSSAGFSGNSPSRSRWPFWSPWSCSLTTTPMMWPTTAPITVSHQGQFPSVTVSFNLAPGVALSDAVNTIQQMQQRIGMPARIHGSFSGTLQAFQTSLASEPVLIITALLAVYIVLGVLYESYIHPITILSTLPSAGVGAVLALMLFHTDLSVIALIGVVLLIGIVKKNAIMMIDFALAAEREQGKPPAEAIFQACLLRFQAHYDDHPGGDVWRVATGAGDGKRVRAPPAAGYRHRWGIDRKPGSHALYYTGGLPGDRPIAAAMGSMAARTNRRRTTSSNGMSHEKKL